MKKVRKVELGTDSVPAHWSLVEAIRELIANAFDEAAATSSPAPLVQQLYPGCWAIRDAGRGLALEHLAGHHASAKADGAGLAAHRGTGLQDALATLARAGAAVLLRSAHGDFVVSAVEGGTPRVLAFEASEPRTPGTEVVIDRIPDREAAAARDAFLALRPARVVETTELGTILACEPGRAEVFVEGIRVLADPELPFGFDLMGLPAAMKRAILRQGSSVARTFCLDRVRRILRHSRSPEVALRSGLAAAGFSLAA